MRQTGETRAPGLWFYKGRWGLYHERGTSSLSLGENQSCTLSPVFHSNAAARVGTFLEHRLDLFPLPIQVYPAFPTSAGPGELPRVLGIIRLSWPLDSSWVQPVEPQAGGWRMGGKDRRAWQGPLPLQLFSLGSGNHCSPHLSDLVGGQPRHCVWPEALPSPLSLNLPSPLVYSSLV